MRPPTTGHRRGNIALSAGLIFAGVLLIAVALVGLLSNRAQNAPPLNSAPTGVLVVSYPSPTLPPAATGADRPTDAPTPTLRLPATAPPATDVPLLLTPLPTATLDPPTLTPGPPPATATATLPPPTATPDIEGWVTQQLAQMDLDAKLAHLLLVGLPGPAADETALRRVRDQGVAGVVLIGRNVQSAAQMQQLTADLQNAAAERAPALPLLIGWNHEGGNVSRTAAGMTYFPAAMALGAADDAALAQAVGRAIGREMLYVGVNMNYAPVLDVNTERFNPIIGMRAFGGDPQRVARIGSAFIGGLQETGVLAVGKHYPGHGGVNVDSHIALPTLGANAETIDQIDLPPFQAAIDGRVAGLMVAHLAIPALDASGMPSSLSYPIVSDLLRGRQGYDGVIMTDDLGMGAILNSYTIEEAAVLALLAGNDLLLSVEPSFFPDRMLAALRQAVSDGRLTEARIDQSLRRVLRLKAQLALAGAPAAEPDWSAHAALAYDVGRRAVQVQRNISATLPLPAGAPLLLVSPLRFNGGSAVGDGRNALTEALEGRGHTVLNQFYTHDNPTDTAAAQQSALILAQRAQVIVVITFDAHIWGAQQALVSALLATGKPVVVVSSNLPYDAEALPGVPAVVAAYGDSAGAVAGVVARLLDGADRP